MMIVRSRELTNLLMRLSKYGYDEPILVRDTNYIKVETMNNDRTTLFITKVKDVPSNLPMKVLLDLNTVIFNKNVVYIREWNTEVADIGEPDVELTTIILARVDTLIDVLERGKYHPFSRVMFKPNSNKLIISLPHYDDVAENDLMLDHELSQADARVLEGNDIALYRCYLLYKQMKFLRSLGISIIKIRYTCGKPMLVTPHNKEFPRLWIAPWVGDE